MTFRSRRLGHTEESPGELQHAGILEGEIVNRSVGGQYQGPVRQICRSLNAVCLSCKGGHVEGKDASQDSRRANDRSAAALQSRDAIPTPPINVVDIIPLDNRPGIRLYQYEFNKGVHVREEVGIQAAIGVQARDIGARHAIHGGELSPDQNFAARIISHAGYVLVGAGHAVLKAAVEAAIRIQTCDAMATLPIDGIKVPSNQYLPVWLDRER